MPYDSYETRRRGYGASSQRTTLGYWVPLAVTVTVATAGLVAWIWNERKDSEGHQDKPSRPSGGDNHQASGKGPYTEGLPGQEPSRSYPEAKYDGSRQQPEDLGVVSRVQDALRRTPSPQQIFDQASRRVTAGVVAAGTVVGNALSSITEEKGGYEDHSRWSEEAIEKGRDGKSTQANLPSTMPKSDKRKIVAIVVSAEAKNVETEEMGYSQAHASILSHLPDNISNDARVFVLIYSPETKQQHSTSSQVAKPSSSIASSYSNIGHEDLQTPGEDGDKPLTLISPRPAQHSSLFDVLYTQAQAITEKATMTMPFNTSSGYVQMLRQISPQVVYVQANLSGDHGESVKNISNWVGQVVLVVGDESGHGGLVDSEDERGAHGEDVTSKWWTSDPKVGLGQIEVVEGLRFGEDWRRRVRGHD